jgi:hypothetical protein
MACSEITQAIQWLQSATYPTKQHPVIAYFTKHFGYGSCLTIGPWCTGTF